MRFLAVSDLHQNAQAAQSIVERSSDVDCVIVAGDLANAHRGLEEIIAILSGIKCPAVLTPGNSETADALQTACQAWPSAVVLHGAAERLLDTDFFGIGGGIPVTPFGSWSFDFSEAEAEELLEPAPAGGIWVAHSPPHGFCDLSSRGKRLGSTAILAAAKRLAPRLIVCGHIHHSSGQTEMLGETQVVNAGPAGMLIELP